MSQSGVEDDLASQGDDERLGGDSENVRVRAHEAAESS